MKTKRVETRMLESGEERAGKLIGKCKQSLEAKPALFSPCIITIQELRFSKKDDQLFKV